jgi:hypothetical protein
MNGTVTMKTITTLIEADSFDEAFEKLTKFPNWAIASVLVRDDEGISYSIGRDVWGRLSKYPASVV